MGFILAQADSQGSPLLGLLILVIFAALIVLLARLGYRKSKAQKEKQDVAKAAYDALSPEEKAAIETKKERERKYFSGKYLGGHPDIAQAIPVTNCQITENEVMVYRLNGQTLGPVVAKIRLAEIQNIVVEDKSTAEKRVTMTRMLAIGVFAFAAKKKEVHPEFYVTISWGGGKIGNETIFEFDGENAQLNANKLRNVIANRVNALAAA